MMFGRRRFADLIQRQLDLFEREHGDAIEEAEERLELYNRAEREEAEELYGNYVDAVETGDRIAQALQPAPLSGGAGVTDVTLISRIVRAVTVETGRSAHIGRIRNGHRRADANRSEK